MKLTPMPRDMRNLAAWLDKVAAFTDQYDWSGLDIEPPPSDFRLIARDLNELADEIGYDLTEHNRRDAELRAEKRDDRRREEAAEMAELIGGAL